MAATTIDRAVDTPRLFEHDVDPELFVPDRLDWLTRRARELDKLAVQLADPGRERPGLSEPIYTRESFPVFEDARRRHIQYRIYDPHLWAGAEYAALPPRVFDAGGPAAELGRHQLATVIRVFSPHAVVALHGDPDLKLVCTVSGETIWWCRPPSETTNAENEDLLRGAFFLRWRESPHDVPLHITPGTGCFVPSRWAHWLEHPTDEPVASFEMGFWTTESIRLRKLYDVNWLLRRARLSPREPGAGSDELKCRAFDAITTLTRRGLEYRGVH